VNSQLEDESDAAAALRRRKRMRRWLVELALGAFFAAALLGANRFSEGGDASPPVAAAFVAGAIVVLALWSFAYAASYRGLDEFERAKELEAIALAGGLCVIFAAAWGTIEAFLAAPDFPLALLAPLFSALYAIIRTLISWRYR